MSVPSAPAVMPRPPIACANKWRTASICRSPRGSARCLVGSVRLSPVRIGEAKALLLGPLTVEPPFRDRGVGQALIARALEEARAKGHRLVILVGDEPYYGKCGFKKIPPGRVTMPGPVDPDRLLVAELAEGASEGLSGTVGGEWGS